jgi:AcrR family transcriptional regulator
VSLLDESSSEHDDRREQILRSAIEVISERGFPETRIADVAERLGVSPALVIYYFKTKDRLLTEAMRYAEDARYENRSRHLAKHTTAAGRLEELVALSTLCEPENESGEKWAIWLDLWAQSARNGGVAKIRQEFDQRWRGVIRTIVRDGCIAGEFEQLDVEDFTIGLSAMLDGFAIQIALCDPLVDGDLAFRTSMGFCADRLGFEWRAKRKGASPSTRKIKSQRATPAPIKKSRRSPGSSDPSLDARTRALRNAR